ncbi:MAG: carboxypeptidase-like regulatory domain-containing protein [Candidatus Micrarchaeota archaeon]|nr:carboxypeptidase-like regulatory domain-containing protein [Candidatus Micrarchaeota archaeon]
MQKLTIFILALLVGAAYCGYTQKLTVQVFDQSLRPVEGAQVYVEHQLNSVAGYVKTKPKLTSANGTVEIVFTNWEEIKSQTKYTYTLYVKYGSELKTANLVVDDPPIDRTYSMQVTAYFAVVSVRDQNGKPLPAKVTIGNRTIGTDTNGDAIFQLPPGKYNVRAEVENTVRNADLMLDKDKAITITIPRYRFELEVVDDFGLPVEAVAELDNQTKKVEGGKAVFENITNENPHLVVRYNESFKKMQLSLKTSDRMQLVFDKTPPKIAEMHHRIQKNGEVVVNVYVQEPGPKASGIASVVLSYEIQNKTSYVPAYTIGYNTFEAKIPPAPKDTIVKYLVKVTDKEGNSGTASGSYVIPTEKKPAEEKKKEEGILDKLGLEHYVAIAVVLGFVAYTIMYYRRKKREKEIEEEMEAARLPPS